MGWNDTSEIRVFSSGMVYVAATGTTLPTTPTSVLSSSLWTGLGLCTEDGVSISYEPNIEEMTAWQVRGPVRREVTGVSLTVTFDLEQWNEANLPFAFGGGTITDLGGGLFKYSFPVGSEALNEKALVVDGTDGSVHNRLVIARGSVTESVETQMQRGALSTFPITYSALEPSDGSSIAYWLTDDATSFAAGS